MRSTNLITLSYRKQYLLLAREVLLPLNQQRKKRDENPSLGEKNRLFKHMRKARENIIQKVLATRVGYVSQVPRWIL